MTKILIKQINNTPATVGDVITFNGLSNVWSQPPNTDQNLFETFNLSGAFIGDSAIVADTITDTLTFAGGTNISLTGNATTDTITINFTGTLGDPDQDIWETFNADTGTTVANTSTDTLNVIGGSGITTAIVGDVLTITNISPGGVQSLFETVVLSGNTAGDLNIVADTTTDILTLVAGTNIQLTGSASTDTITIDFIGVLGNLDQNLWETIVADTGTAIANVTTDTLNIVGGTNVITSIVGDTLTITVSGGGFDQNLWETITADTGSTIANIATDNLIVAGGIGITTTIVGDTLTIDAVAPAVQNLWETVAADTGSVIANIATDTLTIVGAADEIVTSAATDTVTVGIADNPILPGTESTTIPIGTTAQRPVTPSVGMIRYNTTEGCIEVYDGVWECVRTSDTILGGLYQMIFSVNGIVKNAWLDQGADNVSSNASPALCLAKSKVRAYTFVNSRDGADSNLEIYRTPEGIEPTVQQDLLDTWNIINSRTRRKSNFGTDIILDAGDKIGVFSREPGPGSTSPSSAIFIIFLQYLEENFEEVTDNTASDMSA